LKRRRGLPAVEKLKRTGSEQDQAKFKTMQWSDTFKQMVNVLRTIRPNSEAEG
jgi:hypothetical protein